MPRIPTHTAKIVPRGPRGAPISPAAARTGEGAVGRGLEALGRGLQDVGGILGQLAIRKQYLQDSKSRMEIRGLYDATISDIDKAFLDDKDTSHWEQIKEERWKAFEKQVGEYPLSQEASGGVAGWIQAHKDRLDANVRVKITERLQIDTANTLGITIEDAFASGNAEKIKEALAEFNNTKKELFGPDEKIAQRYFQTKALKGLREHYQNQMVKDPAGTLAELDAELEARKKGETTELEQYLPNKDLKSLRDAAERTIRSNQLRAQAELKAKQNETARIMLSELWDGTLTEGNIQDALDAGFLTYERAKDLRKGLAEPEIFDLTAYAQVKDAINGFERGAIDFDDAMDTLTSQAKRLGTSGKGLMDKLYAVPTKSEADWEKEGIDYIESQILEKDMYGFLHGTKFERTRALEARLAFDDALEKAQREGKPILGRDKLLLAHDIMIAHRPTKAEKREKEAPEKLKSDLGAKKYITDADIKKAKAQAIENLGEKATPQQLRTEILRLLGE